MRRFELHELPETQWRNGGGSTREIASGTFGQARDDWHWRLSVASISADGPFSVFSGVDRTAVLVDGAVALTSGSSGMAFTEEGQVHCFSGDIQFEARLHSARARLFNIMVQRGLGTASVVAHRCSVSLGAFVDGPSCLLVLSGRFQIATRLGAVFLHANQGLLCVGERKPCDVALTSDSGCLAEVRLSAGTANACA